MAHRRWGLQSRREDNVVKDYSFSIMGTGDTDLRTNIFKGGGDDATMVEPDDYAKKDKLGWLNGKLEDEPEAGVEHAELISHSSDIENHVKQAGKDVIRLIHDLGLFLSLKEDQHPS
ncbi:uncharacterized protein LOC106404671 isoform X1 [Brassica napus]|uniref:uncharacterized protein LOC106404671 isoform X1 n=2 Tax=Brassica napus TaxID=3708 RepID=UPI0004F14205|nr:uncharacterized protein LOC106404671 isoform X1 [Brassica napus]XP_048598721.1 uncharacterized protein LOC106404671 isoform X1 [Brassica napus]